MDGPLLCDFSTGCATSLGGPSPELDAAGPRQLVFSDAAPESEAELDAEAEANDVNASRCGDGWVDPAEECDDGNLDEDDGCYSDCRRPACGNGIVDRGEACDDGIDNSDFAPNACREDCRLPSCGDYVVDQGEICDGDPDCDEDCTKDCVENADCDNGQFCDGEEQCVAARCEAGELPQPEVPAMACESVLCDEESDSWLRNNRCEPALFCQADRVMQVPQLCLQNQCRRSLFGAEAIEHEDCADREPELGCSEGNVHKFGGTSRSRVCPFRSKSGQRTPAKDL